MVSLVVVVESVHLVVGVTDGDEKVAEDQKERWEVVPSALEEVVLPSYRE